MTDHDKYYINQSEPIAGCLIALRDIILKQDVNITKAWKYGMPFFCYKTKMFCYLWVHKKYKQPYIGIVEGSRIDHPRLIQEKRARMKILLVDPEADLPVKLIESILRQAIDLYKSGSVKIK